MMDGEKELLILFQNYSYNIARLEEKQEQLNGSTYRITPSYSSTGGGGGNRPGSKVESFAEKTEKLTQAITRYQRETRIVEAAIACPELSKIERRVLEWLAGGWHLSSLADAEGIYISRIYKIRDKALRKALRYLETRFEVKHG